LHSPTHDEFEDRHLTVNRDRFPPIVQTCVWCHRCGGIVSLNSRANLLKPSSLQQDTSFELPPRWWENAATVFWKQQRYDWGLLNGYGKAASAPH
jgi:hypothetical protein